MKRVILYGLGNGRILAEQALGLHCQVIAYTDGISQISTYNGKEFFPLEKLRDVKFDCIVITLLNKTARDEAKKKLVEQYSVKCDKIVVFYEYLEYMTKADKVMNQKNTLIEGMVLGMSTAECGIITDQLRPRFCNLAVSSQDIFYNYQTFNYVSECYKEKLDLRYLVVDMYDYRWFNIDLSLSKSIDAYICKWHGLRYKLHNLEGNINFGNDDITRIKQFSEYRNGDMEMDLFSFSDYYGDVEPYVRGKCIEDRDYSEEDVHPRLIDPIIRRETISENKKWMKHLLAEVSRKYPFVRIILLLLPRYVAMNRILDQYHVMWKEDFEETVGYYVKEYNAEFYNYRDYAPISENPYFFYDLEHMNYAGAVAFSSLLSQKIL